MAPVTTVISARHISAIYKISGVDGSIKWRPGGSHSDFDIASEAFLDSGKEGLGRWFHFQHDARILYSDGGNETVSLFVNGRAPQRVFDSPFSRGVVLRLDSNRCLATIQAECLTEG